MAAPNSDSRRAVKWHANMFPLPANQRALHIRVASQGGTGLSYAAGRHLFARERFSMPAGPVRVGPIRLPLWRPSTSAPPRPPPSSQHELGDGIEGRKKGREPRKVGRHLAMGVHGAVRVPPIRKHSSNDCALGRVGCRFACTPTESDESIDGCWALAQAGPMGCG